MPVSARVCSIDHGSAKPSFPWMFFVLTFGLSWVFWYGGIAVSRSSPTSSLVLAAEAVGSFGPTLVAFAMTLRRSGRIGAHCLLRRGFPSKIPVQYLLLIAIIPLGVNGSAYWLAGGRHPHFSPVTILYTFVLYFFLGGSVGEEFGWRGFALDRLQSRWDWILSSVVLGLIWSAWHFPLHFVAGTTQSSTPQWVFFLSTTALAVIMTWIYNRTGRNLFGMLLLHTFENITVVMFPPIVVAGDDLAAHYQAWIMAAVAVILIIMPVRSGVSAAQPKGMAIGPFPGGNSRPGSWTGLRAIQAPDTPSYTGWRIEGARLDVLPLVKHGPLRHQVVTPGIGISF